MNTNSHFPFMIFASLLVFFLILRIILTKKEFKTKRIQIAFITYDVSRYVIWKIWCDLWFALVDLLSYPHADNCITSTHRFKIKPEKNNLLFSIKLFICSIYSFIFILFWMDGMYTLFWKIPYVANYFN